MLVALRYDSVEKAQILFNPDQQREIVIGPEAVSFDDCYNLLQVYSILTRVFQPEEGEIVKKEQEASDDPLYGARTLETDVVCWDDLEQEAESIGFVVRDQ